MFAAEEDPEVHLGQLKRFSLRELQVATDSFSNKKNRNGVVGVPRKCLEERAKALANQGEWAFFY